MNSIKFFLLALVTVVVFYACINKSNMNDPVELIQVNPFEASEYINLSELVESVKCIRLQPDSNDIIGRAREVIIRNKYIYVRDIAQQTLFVFDKSGKFVSKLNKRGQGPDEYSFMGPIFIEEDEIYVEIVNMGNSTKIKYENISFNLVEVEPFPRLNYSSCKRNNGLYYFATQQSQNVVNDQKTNAGLLVSDGQNHIDLLFDKSIETNNSTFSANIESFAVNNKNELFASFMFDNTFYKLEGADATPVARVDFGKYGIDNKMGLESTEKQMKYIESINGLASFPVLNLHNDEIFAFSYYFKQDENQKMFRERDFRLYIKMMRTNKVYHTKKFKNDLTDFPEYIYISSYFFNCAYDVWYEDYLIDVVLPAYYFLSKDYSSLYSEELGVVTEQDNPIIVFMKLRK